MSIESQGDDQRFAGIACGDGGCQHIGHEAAKALWDEAMRQKADRIARIPDEATAIRLFVDAHTRLKEMGWKDSIYAPRNAPIEMIECGSTGIHAGYRDEHGLWINDASDTWPSRAVLYRLASLKALESSPDENTEGT